MWELVIVPTSRLQLRHVWVWTTIYVMMTGKNHPFFKNGKRVIVYNYEQIIHSDEKKIRISVLENRGVIG
jgi:hypothetical protein